MREIGKQDYKKQINKQKKAIYGFGNLNQTTNNPKLIKTLFFNTQLVDITNRKQRETK